MRMISNGVVELGISLPIDTVFNSESDLTGVGVGDANTDVAMYLKADVSGNRAILIADTNEHTSHLHYFEFTYKIIA